jgi:hypothetical protein
MHLPSCSRYWPCSTTDSMRVSEALDSGSIPDEATKPWHAVPGFIFAKRRIQARLSEPMSKNKPPAIEDC